MRSLSGRSALELAEAAATRMAWPCACVAVMVVGLVAHAGSEEAPIDRELVMSGLGCGVGAAVGLGLARAWLRRRGRLRTAPPSAPGDRRRDS
jgi:hypothetical protein